MLSELVEYIIKQLVEDKELLIISTKQEDAEIKVHITVSARDRGKVIGKEGQTVKALKAFLGILVSENVQIMIDLAQVAQ